MHALKMSKSYDINDHQVMTVFFLPGCSSLYILYIIPVGSQFWPLYPLMFDFDLN